MKKNNIDNELLIDTIVKFKTKRNAKKNIITNIFTIIILLSIFFSTTFNWIIKFQPSDKNNIVSESIFGKIIDYSTEIKNSEELEYIRSDIIVTNNDNVSKKFYFNIQNYNQEWFNQVTLEIFDSFKFLTMGDLDFVNYTLSNGIDVEPGETKKIIIKAWIPINLQKSYSIKSIKEYIKLKT